MDWKSVVGPVLQSAAPKLAKGLLGQIPVIGPLAVQFGGQAIDDAIGGLIASAFGVEATPEAVNAAIQNAPSDVAAAKLQAVEAEAQTKWPALAEIAKAEEETARVQITTTADSMKAEILAASEMPESRLRTFVQFVNSVWRPMFAVELLAECAFFFFSFTTLLIGALIKNDTFDIDAMIKLMPLAVTLLLPYMAARFGLLGYHMNLRTREKETVTEAVTEAQKPVSLNEIKALLKASGVKIK